MKINPHVDRNPLNTETEVEVFASTEGRNAIGTDRQSINTGVDGMTENRMSRITGDRVAYQEETGNVTMRGQENFSMKFINNEGPNIRSSLATFNMSEPWTRSIGDYALGSIYEKHPHLLAQQLG